MLDGSQCFPQMFSNPAVSGDIGPLSESHCRAAPHRRDATVGPFELYNPGATATVVTELAYVLSKTHQKLIRPVELLRETIGSKLLDVPVCSCRSTDSAISTTSSFFPCHCRLSPQVSFFLSFLLSFSLLQTHREYLCLSRQKSELIAGRLSFVRLNRSCTRSRPASLAPRPAGSGAGGRMRVGEIAMRFLDVSNCVRPLRRRRHCGSRFTDRSWDKPSSHRTDH